MTVELICPFCGFSKKISRKKIPAAAKMAVCPRCHEKFPLSRRKLPGPGSLEHPPETNEQNAVYIPPVPHTEKTGTSGEEQTRLGFFEDFFQTFKKALFQPGAFFKGQNRWDGLGEPFAFGLLAGGFGDMLAFFWPALFFSLGIVPVGDSVLRGLSGIWIFLTLMVGIPLAVILNMILFSGLLHLMLMMVRGGKEGYRSTFRVIAYSQAALAWNVIPFMGSWVATVWKLVIQVIGLREIHHISYTRVIAAFLLPVFILFVLIILVLSPLLMILF